MAAASPWPTIHAERQALVADLGPVSGDQWATPSLCRGWSVHDVLAHMVATAKMTPRAFFAAMLRSRFQFNVMVAKAIARETAAGPDETLAEFRRHLQSTSHPPGPVESWLGETIVHGEDIRRPLHIAHTYPMDAVTRVATFYLGSNLLIGAKRRTAGLRLQASDTDWSSGEDPEVTGPMLSLLLAMTGRQAALVDLTGGGVAVLQARG